MGRLWAVVALEFSRPMSALAPLILLPIMYVVLILPQRKRMKAQQALVAAIGPGSAVMTTSGIHGMVVDVDGDTAHLEIADGVVIRIAKQAIARRIDTPLGSVNGELPPGAGR